MKLAPKLSEEFPIDWEEDGYVSRREFFKFMTAASGGLAAATVGLAAWSQYQRRTSVSFEPRRIALITELGLGEARSFRYPRESDLCLLIRRPDESFVAFSQRCTHLSCPVLYDSQKDQLVCPCHNGAFSARDGKVLFGPPPAPLAEIVLETRGHEVWAVGVRRGERPA